MLVWDKRGLKNYLYVGKHFANRYHVFQQSELSRQKYAVPIHHPREHILRMWIAPWSAGTAPGWSKSHLTSVINGKNTDNLNTDMNGQLVKQISQSKSTNVASTTAFSRWVTYLIFIENNPLKGQLWCWITIPLHNAGESYPTWKNWMKPLCFQPTPQLHIFRTVLQIHGKSAAHILVVQRSGSGAWFVILGTAGLSGVYSGQPSLDAEQEDTFHW